MNKSYSQFATKFRYLYLAFLTVHFGIYLQGGEKPEYRKFESGFIKSEITYKDSGDKETTRGIRIWYPTNDQPAEGFYAGKQKGLFGKDAKCAPGKFPLVIFSHGLWSHPEFSAFLTEEMARAGLIVIGVIHKDGTTEKRPGWMGSKMPQFLKPDKWTDKNNADRRDDMKALLDFMEKQHKQADSAFYGRIDLTKIGAMGHSMGGYTVTGLVGGWPSWEDKRVKCALLMSPFVMPYYSHDNIEKIKVPVMIQGGTFDFGITPHAEKMYKTLSTSKYFPIFQNETHFAWINVICKGKRTDEAVEEGNAKWIVRYSLSFFQSYLQNSKDSAKFLIEPNKELDSLRSNQP